MYMPFKQEQTLAYISLSAIHPGMHAHSYLIYHFFTMIIGIGKETSALLEFLHQ